MHLHVHMPHDNLVRANVRAILCMDFHALIRNTFEFVVCFVICICIIIIVCPFILL